MSYLNPLRRYGLQAFFEKAAAVGIKGLIIPDWPVEEEKPWLPTFDGLGLTPIMMVTPNTPLIRIERITRATRSDVVAHKMKVMISDELEFEITP